MKNLPSLLATADLLRGLETRLNKELKPCFYKNPAKEKEGEYTAPHVFIGDLPAKRVPMETKDGVVLNYDFPFILLKIAGGEDTLQSCEPQVGFVLGTYNSDPVSIEQNQTKIVPGYQDILNMLDQIRLILGTNRTINNAWRLQSVSYGDAQSANPLYELQINTTWRGNPIVEAVQGIDHADKNKNQV